ncbi:MAG: mitochondrial fission ELM1 family protein [Proteobacteria bacterium]|nr:mitochondrial fission ELM1 family protein [Pseudomonadota bacterium]
MKTYKITAILDGRPGHEKQTQGIINALEKYVPVEITYLKIKISLFSDIINWLKTFAGFCWKIGKTDDVDFVIGTGTHTHPHVIKIGNDSGAKKIICMSPASFLIKMFDLCFVPNHDRFKLSKNIFLTIGPPNISENKNIHKNDKGLVLIGGRDDKSHVWDSDKILGYIEKIVSSESENINWTISSSPRTPVEMENKISRFTAGMEKASFFRFSDTKKGWVEKQYDASSIVWVTADSMSMIYEALTAGCTTYIIPMEWKQKGNKFSFSEQDLYKNKLAISYNKWIQNRGYNECGKSINESDKCAREILRRWCPESLQ